MKEKMTDVVDNALHENIFNGLKEKAMNELKNQINVLPKNDSEELVVDIVSKE
jgi:hypothetical protein